MIMENENQEKSRLPELRKQMTDDVVASALKKEEEISFFARLQKFTAILNTGVEEDKLQQHPLVKKAKYLPISFVEMAMDELFFGMWCTEDFRWNVIANEVVASLTVRFMHPVTKEWLRRTGVAATQIMVDSIPEQQKSLMTKQEINAWATDLHNKKPAALEMGGFAALKADCFKNACLSIGKYFGRDVNRAVVANDYLPTLKDPDERKAELRMQLSEAIDNCQDRELVQPLIDEILKAEEAGINTVEFYKAMLKKLNDGIS